MANEPESYDYLGWIRRILAQRCCEYREPPFQLSGGGESRYYIDARRLTFSQKGAYYVAAEICRRLFERGYVFGAIGGPALGAAPIVSGVLMYAELVYRTELRGFLVRPEAKGHGIGEGFVGTRPWMNDRVVLVDDVLTTGASLLRTVEALRGLKVYVPIEKAIVLVDREEGGRAALAAEGIPVEALATLSELLKCAE